MNKHIIGFFLLTILYVTGCTPKSTRLFNKAEAQFKEAEYQTAIENYQQAIAKGYPKGSVANYKIAEAFRRSNRIHESEQFYEKAVSSNVEDEEAYFWYAASLKANGKYENAKEQYKKYASIGTNLDLVNRSKKEISNIDALSDIVGRKPEFEVKNIEQLNTDNAEYAPYFSKGKLYFSTNRGVAKMHAATNTGFTDIWEYIFDGTESFSGQAQALPENINTANAHEATPVFSKDGKTLYFSRGNTGNKKGAQDVDIYMSKLQAGIWADPTLVPVSTDASWDSSPALSADGKKLYFASNREGGKGGVDIYYATIDSSGKWGNVTNLGEPVNTKGNDMFPYEDEFGTFYFASDGHPSLGSLDIFKITKDENNKQKVYNLGAPVNTSYDDFALIAKDSTIGYFSSNRPNGKGDDDIYEFSTFKKANYVVNGVTITADSGLVIANVPVIITLNGDTIAKVMSDDKGKFTFNGEPEKEYNVKAEKDGFMVYNEMYSTMGKTVPKNKLTPGENTIALDLSVKMVKKIVGVVVVIDNVYYDYNKWDIRPDAAISLNTVVKTLNDNPDIKIELSSHTDARGSADYNKKLSQKRAQSAVDYIISQGINKDRISAKGYGEDKPIVIDAKTEEEHQINRRTEFQITNITNPNLKIIRKGEENLIEKQD